MVMAGRRGLQRRGLGAAEGAQRASPRGARAPPAARASAAPAAPPRARQRLVLRGAGRTPRHAERRVWTYLIHFWNMVHSISTWVCSAAWHANEEAFTSIFTDSGVIHAKD